MKEFLFPWQIHVLKKYPLALIVFIIVVSIVLAIITWIKEKSHNH